MQLLEHFKHIQTTGSDEVGAAYIFKKGLDGSGNETWTQQAKLLASDAAASDQFGEAVAICNDYAIISAPYSDENENINSGSAYIFKKDDGAETWSQITKLVPSDGEGASGYFGHSVSIDGNYAAVGEVGDITSGHVWIFKKGLDGSGNETWTEKAKLVPGIASNKSRGMKFGNSISLKGDYIIIVQYMILMMNIGI